MTEPSTSQCTRCGTSLSGGTAGGLCPKCLLAMNLDSRTMPDEEKPPVSPAPTPEELAAKLPQFEILEYLGRGGMGIVYKARQKALDRIVAIKILAGEWQHDPGFSLRFEKEAKILAKLNHPNIVTVHDFGESDGLYYIVMEFVDGVNLRDLLRDGHLEPKQALGIIPPVCEALQFAHDKGIVHRDIKPENLLLDRDGRIKIADFGIAAMVGARGERSGTPPYMAPEQGGASTEVDHRVDIYALGAVLYEALTGERPDGPLRAPSQKVQIDIRIDDIVLRALNKEPERRYNTADQFRTMVETVATTPAPTASSAPPAPAAVVSAPASTPLDPRWNQAAAILLIVVGAINLLSAALSLLILPILHAVLGRVAGFRFEHPGGLGGGTPRVETVEMFTTIRSLSPVDAFNSGLPAFLLFSIGALFTVAISILTLLGGRHMLRGTSRSMAITGAIACCLTPLWWPAGLAIGAFALVILFLERSPAAATAAGGTGGTSLPVPTPGPRLSGMAATAAGLHVLAIGMLGLSILLASNFATAFLLLLLLLLFIPGSILGWIAAARIRKSDGQLTGMGLAKFAAMLPVIAVGVFALLLFIRIAALLAVDRHLGTDETTLLIVCVAAAITGITALAILFSACSRHLSGTPKPVRSKRKRVAAIVLLALWLGIGLLLWLQRPRQVDSWTTASSPDQQSTARVATMQRMRIFGHDLLTYKLIVRNHGGAADEDWEMAVPAGKRNDRADPASNSLFEDHGRIEWAPDSKSLTISLRQQPIFRVEVRKVGRLRGTLIPLHDPAQSPEQE